MLVRSHLVLGRSERSRPRNALERREWTAEEDEIIKDGVRQYGYRWRRIASQLQGRSDDAVRNRWSRLKGGEEGELKAGLNKGGASGRNAAGDTGVTGGDGGSSRHRRGAFPEPSRNLLLRRRRQPGCAARAAACVCERGGGRSKAGADRVDASRGRDHHLVGEREARA